MTSSPRGSLEAHRLRFTHDKMARGFFRRRRKRRAGVSGTGVRARLMPASLFSVALAGLGLANVASLLLVLEQFEAIALPGCGLHSSCFRATQSVWGKVPLVGWSVAFVGFAYFFGALAGLIVVRQSLPPGFRQVVRGGAAVSMLYLGVMVFGGFFCSYCLAAHVGNLVFWIAIEASPVGKSNPAKAFLAAGGIFAFLLAVLAGAAWLRAESDLAASTAEIISESGNRVEAPPVQAERGADKSISDIRPRGFAGRYPRGPEKAAVRVVAFTDYQCPVCAGVEKQLRDARKQVESLSVSVKHFPACEECNVQFRGRNLHPNACRAAAVVEAAGALGGKDAFWAVHEWLFERGGSFSNDDLQEKLTSLGLDIDRFLSMMDDPTILRRIQADIDEALLLGVQGTPMVFINGVELRGLAAESAVERAILAVAAEAPPVRSAEADRPPAAPERFRLVWSEQPVTELPPDKVARRRGSPDARVQAVLWGDYQDPQTIAMDISIRRLVSARTDAAYSYRHFPINEACNPYIKRTDNLMACRAARAAEAAGTLGGDEGYWSMHEWLMENPLRMDSASLRAVIQDLGFDPDAFFKTMKEPGVQSAIEEDAAAAVELNRTDPPWLFVNGRHVPRFLGEGEAILKTILDEAGDSAR